MTTENVTAAEGIAITKVAATEPMTDDAATAAGLGTRTEKGEPRYWYEVTCENGHVHYIGDDPALGTVFECHDGTKNAISPAAPLEDEIPAEA